MKIATLMENSACQDGFFAEHGLSLYIETGKRKILFDAGQTEAFGDNAKKLGIDLSQVDTAVLSHGHYDHGGGLIRFLAENDSASVYLNKFAFEPHYNAADKYIGLDSRLSASNRLIYVDDGVDLGDGISIQTLGTTPCSYPIEPYGLQVERDGMRQFDDFQHEQYLLICEKGRRICFSGCSHKGILNILERFQPDVLIGGFHFKSVPADSAILREAAKIMMCTQTVFYTGHCTGDAQYGVLKSIMGDRLHQLSSGAVIRI